MTRFTCSFFATRRLFCIEYFPIICVVSHSSIPPSRQHIDIVISENDTHSKPLCFSTCKNHDLKIPKEIYWFCVLVLVLWRHKPFIWKWFFIPIQLKLIFLGRDVHLASFWCGASIQLGNGSLFSLGARFCLQHLTKWLKIFSYFGTFVTMKALLIGLHVRCCYTAYNENLVVCLSWP